MNKNQKLWIGGIAAAVVLGVCLCAAVFTISGIAVFQRTRSIIERPAVVLEATPIHPVDEKPLPPTQPPDAALESTPTQELEQDLLLDNGSAEETLNTLNNTIVPINDPRDLASRLAGIEDIPETTGPVPSPLAVGAKESFHVTNVETNEKFEVEASLRHVTDHLYFWIENGVSYNEDDLRLLCETFENEIYPTNRAFFGSEWSPGIDEDPHLYVLYAGGIGSSLAGYFSHTDAIHPFVHPYSNGHEMFLINADNVRLGEEYVYSTMAHEFQHMIHWYGDRNEESWLNEGFSVLAEFLNGYNIGGFDLLYVEDPDLQLTDWPAPPNSSPNYGASFLFLAYFLDRFGDEATQTLVGHPENGMSSIDAVLTEMNITDSMTGEPIQADDIFADWVVTSFLNDPSVEDGRFAYQRYGQAPKPEETEDIDICSPEHRSRQVEQYGVDYIYIDCDDSTTLEFTGASEVAVLSQDAFSGNYAFWSNKGDESNMTLSREFDFTGVQGPLSMTYHAWFDLETDYDYLYLVASEDGENWQMIKTPSGTERNPTGNSFGWGYNGQTSGWLEESVDLSQFAGKKVQLRFEYVTDAAVNGEGFLLDDVRIPAIDYEEGFEQSDGGWVADGFARIQNRLPQVFKVSLIANGDTTTVEEFSIHAGENLLIPLQFDSDLRDAVLVVSGVTRFTNQPAGYSFRFVDP